MWRRKGHGFEKGENGQKCGRFSVTLMMSILMLEMFSGNVQDP